MPTPNRWLPLLVLGVGVVSLAPVAVHGGGPYQFYSLSACRMVDTRSPNGPSGGPALQPGVSRLFPARGTCGIPQGAKAIVVNVTIAVPTGAGYLTLWPSDITKPNVSTINFSAGESALANGAIVAVSSLAFDLAVEASIPSNGTVHVILDVTGYFQ